MRERARKDHDEEKRQLQDKMEMEMAQLQSQLKIFQKVGLGVKLEKSLGNDITIGQSQVLVG